MLFATWLQDNIGGIIIMMAIFAWLVKSTAQTVAKVAGKVDNDGTVRTAAKTAAKSFLAGLFKRR